MDGWMRGRDERTTTTKGERNGEEDEGSGRNIWVGMKKVKYFKYTYQHSE